jgi:hypothetical protein
MESPYSFTFHMHVQEFQLNGSICWELVLVPAITVHYVQLVVADFLEPQQLQTAQQCDVKVLHRVGAQRWSVTPPVDTELAVREAASCTFAEAHVGEPTEAASSGTHY